MNWRRDQKFILSQGFKITTEEEERIQRQKKDEALFRVRWARRCQVNILDRVLLVLYSKRIVGNQTTVSEVSNLLNATQKELGGMLGISQEAIVSARDAVNSLRTLRLINGAMPCGNLRVVIKKEIENFDELARMYYRAALERLSVNS